VSCDDVDTLVGFEVLIVASMEMAVYWFVTPWSFDRRLSVFQR
jgi:hypothetical protein